MIALRVSKNGALLCTAGAEDLGVLKTNVVASGLLGPSTHQLRADESVGLRIHIGGLTPGKTETTNTSDGAKNANWLWEIGLKSRSLKSTKSTLLIRNIRRIRSERRN
jgi:hypothetical protein